MSWQRVKGHERLVKAFDGVVKLGRLAHGYLFAGPPGVGKRLFAEELGRALLCENPPGGRLEACDKCPACVQAAAGTHPDLFIATKPEESLEFPIAVMRALCQSLSLKSARGRGKVAIVDDADDLNEESANCFLKTLEEPPPRSVLLLIGTSPQRQLSTILSRCQVIRFSALPDNLVAEILRASGVEDQKLLARLVHLSAGSPGQARALADPELWEFRSKLLAALAQSPFDSVTLGREWMHFVEEAGKESAAQRRRAAQVLHLLVEFLNTVLASSVAGPPRLAEPEDHRVVEIFAKRTNPDLVLNLLSRCLDAEMHIDRKVQLVLILEALVDALEQRLKSA